MYRYVKSCAIKTIIVKALLTQQEINASLPQAHIAHRSAKSITLVVMLPSIKMYCVDKHMAIGVVLLKVNKYVNDKILSFI